MRKLLIILFLVSAFCRISYAENNIMFEKANQLYHNKLYDSAAKLYTQMLQDGYCDAVLYYNAGNAFYRTHKTGMAVWSFKKALSIRYEKNYLDNLLLSQKRIKDDIKSGDDIFFIRWWKNTYNLMSLNKWAISALVFFLLTIVLLYLKNIRKSNRVPSYIRTASMILTVFCLFFLFVKYYHVTYRYTGIIVEPETTFTTKTQNAILSEGIEVQFISRNNDKLTVQLPDGRIGLIRESAFRRL